jgi:secondary thiamine-phosphate synthase enzyme
MAVRDANTHNTVVPVFHKTMTYTPKHAGDIINITEDVQAAAAESRIKSGLVHLFVTHSTAALTTIEYEPGVLADLKRALSVLAPDDIPYAHDSRWGDGNGRSHVKAALVGPSLTIPFSDRTLLLGTWQQVVLLELDIHGGRQRTVVCTVTG